MNNPDDKIEALKEIIREANGVTKDIRHATREAREILPPLSDEILIPQVDKLIEDTVNKTIRGFYAQMEDLTQGLTLDVINHWISLIRVLTEALELIQKSPRLKTLTAEELYELLCIAAGTENILNWDGKENKGK